VDATVDVGLGFNAVIHRLNGAPCANDDWMPFDQPIPLGKKVEFSATNGRSSNISPGSISTGAQAGSLRPSVGRGSGRPRSSCETANCATQAGMQNLHTVLHPGESIRSPRIMQTLLARWRPVSRLQLFRAHAGISCENRRRIVEPPIVHLSTAFYELNDTNEQNVLSHLDSSKAWGSRCSGWTPTGQAERFSQQHGKLWFPD